MQYTIRRMFLTRAETDLRTINVTNVLSNKFINGNINFKENARMC